MSGERDRLPDRLELVRTTETFDQHTAPAGLRRAHRVAAGVWARLVVHTGEVRFVFEDDTDRPRTVGAGQHVVIPPQRPHHVEFPGPATLAIEFYRPPANEPGPVPGQESTGLTGGDPVPDH